MLFSILLKLGIQKEFQKVEKGINLFILGFYHNRSLLTDGLGQYLFGIACLTFDDVKYENLNKRSHESSRLEINLNRFKIIYDFIESGYLHENSEKMMPDLLRSILNTMIFYKIQKNKNPNCIY